MDRLHTRIEQTLLYEGAVGPRNHPPPCPRMSPPCVYTHTISKNQNDDDDDDDDDDGVNTQL